MEVLKISTEAGDCCACVDVGAIADDNIRVQLRGLNVKNSGEVAFFYLLLNHVLVLLGGVDPSHHLPLVQNLVLHHPRLLGHCVYRPLLGLDQRQEVISLFLQLLCGSRSNSQQYA